MILFVGDEPSTLNTDPVLPFKGAACEKRLKEWIEKVRGSKLYVIINRVDEDAAEMMGLAIALKEPIVALGNNASKSLGKIPHFKLPHPSGRNRQINNKAFIEAKLLECKSYIKEKSCSK